MKSFLHICVAVTALIFASPAHAGFMVWEDHFVDGDPITTGTSVTGVGATVAITTTVFSDSDGGTFDLSPGLASDYFTFSIGTLGNHPGYLQMAFDNENDDPSDYLEMVFVFDRPVQGLAFSLLDVDGSRFGAWDDGVEVFFDGVNAKSDPSIYDRGRAVFLDNESYMDGFEGGNRSIGPTSDLANVDFNLGDAWVQQIRIRYFSTDDATSDPGFQVLGVSDFSFASIPEPSNAILFSTSAWCIVLRRRRRIATDIPDGHSA